MSGAPLALSGIFWGGSLGKAAVGEGPCLPLLGRPCHDGAVMCHGHRPIPTPSPFHWGASSPGISQTLWGEGAAGKSRTECGQQEAQLLRRFPRHRGPMNSNISPLRKQLIKAHFGERR